MLPKTLERDVGDPSAPSRVCREYVAGSGKKREREGSRLAGNVLDMAAAMGIQPLTEEQYRKLQKLGSFDA